MKDEEQKYNLVYHIQYSRPLRGCLWIFVFVAIAVVALVLTFVKVDMPEGLPPAREGSLYYRNDSLLQLQVLMRSPMPLPLPAYVDPARREEAAAQALPKSFVPTLSQAPAEPIFSAAHDSAVLDAASLIALPPEGLQDAPPTADGKEVQP